MFFYDPEFNPLLDAWVEPLVDPLVDSVGDSAAEYIAPYSNVGEYVLKPRGCIYADPTPFIAAESRVPYEMMDRKGSNAGPKTGKWRLVYVPRYFLDDPRLRSTTKCVGMAIQVGVNDRLPAAAVTSPRRLARVLNLARNTVRMALRQLAECQYNLTEGFLFGKAQAIGIPVMLLFNKTISASAKVIYGLLMFKATPKFDRNTTRSVRLSRLSKVLPYSVSTIKRALYCLQFKQWISYSQKHKHADMHIQYTNPIERLFADIRGQIAAAPSLGEGLARAWCTLLIYSDNYNNNYQPRWLCNPKTGAPMHLDRLYHDLKIAIEFQGPQHFRATAKYDAKTVAGQKHRDQHKRRQCKLNEVLLIALQAEDLSLEGMLKKFEGKVPLRDLTGCQKIIAYLTQQSQAYLNSFSANF